MALGMQRRHAARLLAGQVRSEAALLEHERWSLQRVVLDFQKSKREEEEKEEKNGREEGKCVKKSVVVVKEEKVDQEEEEELETFNPPPLPSWALRLASAAADDDDTPVGCTAGCRLHHRSNARCLRCGRAWAMHNGHTCSYTGARGSFPLN
jgi:hypothetical protein